MPEQSSLLQWIIDTRPLWPEATQTSNLTQYAVQELGLLSTEEQAQVLRYYFVRDAKMCLVSHLLKRAAIVACLAPHVPWPQAIAVADKHGKPYFAGRSEATETGPRIAFNVSHQDGVVVLVAAKMSSERDSDSVAVSVGIDVVSVDERSERDRREITAHGWLPFLRVYDSVLGPAEFRYLATLTEEVDDDDDDASRLRLFYAAWCLREAYVKMDGRGLSFPELAHLEFDLWGLAAQQRQPLSVAPPDGTQEESESPSRVEADAHAHGQAIRTNIDQEQDSVANSPLLVHKPISVSVTLHGRPIDSNTRISIYPMQRNTNPAHRQPYYIATAITSSNKFPFPEHQPSSSTFPKHSTSFFRLITLSYIHQLATQHTT